MSSETTEIDDESPTAAETDRSAVETKRAGISLSNIEKSYGDVLAVEDLSLDVEPGEFLVLLGPSGCGKSTTLRMIAGLETPTDGRIDIGDEEVTRTLPQERGLSMVFQSYALYPHKTVRGNLEFPLGKMDVSDEERDAKVEHTAELLEIEDLLDKKPGQLSGGQRQRVAVGRTIIREPRAFLMDEPLSNLDAQLRVRTRFEIRELQQELGTTTVYVTHDQEEAMSVADRIAVMNDGELQQVGTPEEIYKTPTNEFVAGFIGNPPMCFFDVSVGEGVELLPNGESVRLDTTLPADTETLGVRPEDVHLLRTPAADVANVSRPDLDDLTNAMTCAVRVIEPLGNAYELELARGEYTFTARVRALPEGVSPGADVEVAFDRTELHAFDATGEAIR
ncbi:multiple sugar-binding transport ATP-binding protein [Haladaptatus paucihalophilus DX253]|uniref:ABC-type D-xylose/L-arabinose transporter n=1 Tax=Haladaptatus paucihalophilus DX253 TaxID=797209 RepID=E7QVY3_HALPU|nr:ABC transporter ATP-binding protein [Haladaptatus paucihalophilus]EFW91396.1 multiple sugar-binding transport ATP-binding protein [Haladaptatus paucihalophilus DX253]SHK99804.1 multiple sugar transport system ATP-binding protein [Haladaptatus paucihalophilus DX253]